MTRQVTTLKMSLYITQKMKTSTQIETMPILVSYTQLMTHIAN